MKKKYLAVLVLSAFMLPSAGQSAEDASGFDGWVKLGMRTVDEENNSAKFQEYRDLDDGILGKIGLSNQKDSYHFDFLGKNIGLNDQSYKLKGGVYDQFKFSLFFDDTPHNYTFDARSFYSGIGTNVLSYPGSAPANGSEVNWGLFDHAIKRNKFGGEVEASLSSPFYFTMGVDKLETKGLKPLILGDFSRRTEVPEPINHTTENLTLRGGYQAKDYLFELSGMLSSFDNVNKYLMWESPTTASTNYVATLPPDNDYGKMAAKFVWKNLPYTSVFALSGNYAKMESDFSTTDLNLAADSSNSTMLGSLNRTTFDGEKTYSDIMAALTSRPTAAMDTKISYKRQTNSNDSSTISYTKGSTAETNANRLFDYTRDVFGAELGYKLPCQTKMTAGYEYNNIDRRNRPEFESTTDHSFLAKLKNSSLDSVTGEIQYKRIARNFDPASGTTVVINDFSADERTVDEIKLGVELFASDNLDFGADYTYASTDYDPVLANGTTRGRDKDSSNAFYLDALWRLPQHITLSGFAGYETREVSSLHREGSTPYEQNVDDDFWTYGLTGKMPLMDDKLQLILNWEYQKSDGESNFALISNKLNIPSVADYSKQLLEAKATYACSKKLGVTMGYAYEKYQYRDTQMEGYDYTAASSSYLSGAYAFNDYEANVGYVMLRWGF